MRVLDFASVGPERAPRASFRLWCRGHKLGPVASKQSNPDRAPTTLLGHRLMKRALLDLKSVEAARLSWHWLRGRVVLESFVPVWSIGSASATPLSGTSTAKSSTAQPVALVKAVPAAVGPGHDVTIWPGPLPGLHRAPRRWITTAPRCHRGRHRRRGDAAVMAIMAALLRRTQDPCGRILRRVHSRCAFGLMSLYADEYLATGTEPRPGSLHLTRTLRLLHHLHLW